MSECPNAIAVSGRIRLARNYPDLPFSSMERPEDAESCIQRASQAMHTGTDEIYTLHLLRTMTPTDRMALVDAHLISRDLLKHSAIGAAGRRFAASTLRGHRTSATGSAEGTRRSHYPAFAGKC